jgi:hypothetical protein
MNLNGQDVVGLHSGGKIAAEEERSTKLVTDKIKQGGVRLGVGIESESKVGNTL